MTRALAIGLLALTAGCRSQPTVAPADRADLTRHLAFPDTPNGPAVLGEQGEGPLALNLGVPGRARCLPAGTAGDGEG